jgi:hypothetical protein
VNPAREVRVPTEPGPEQIPMSFRPHRLPGFVGRSVTLTWLLLLAPAVYGQPFGEKLDYNFDIRPILSDRCFACHGPDARARKAELRLDQSDSAYSKGALVRGKPEESEVMSRITATDDTRMPPRTSKLSLSSREVERIGRWIAEGAQYKPHWAYIPLPESVLAPDVADPRWPATPIDRFILAGLEREGLSPSPPASKTEWLRRVTLDLTGLPPTPAQVDAFLADDAPGSFDTVVDRLLNSTRFGERLAIEWLDVARYADSFGYQADGETHVWPWRDWVIKSFNDNLPYDQFLTWQIAGDLLPSPTREQRLATAFCRLNRMTNEGGSIAEEWRNEYVSDRVHTFATGILALTMECSRCHDHKYDPITQKEYYALGAYFNSIDEWGTYANSKLRPTPTLLLPTPDQERLIAGLGKKVDDADRRSRRLEKSREPAFLEWLSCGGIRPEVPGLVGSYSLDRLVDGRNLENFVDTRRHGTSGPGNTIAPGKFGAALRFTGDDPAELLGTLGQIDRANAFTVAFWMQTSEALPGGVVFHRSTGTDVGYHGTELSFDEGRLFFGLIRFWPGNAIAIRTRAALPVNEWLHVAVTYDGSGMAAGLRIALNGAATETEVLRDRLFKNLEASGNGLTFGERFRGPGFKGGTVDEVSAFNRALTAVEVMHLYDGKALTEAIDRKDFAALRDYYFGAIDPVVRAARQELREARQLKFAAETEVFEVMTMEELPGQRPAYVLARGDYDAPKDKPVGRGTPAALPPLLEGVPRDRLGLARWLTEPRHPLTARVAVNRYWQMLFGRGIVATAENFGQQGALPTHPRLIDWLARSFIASGWDAKKLLKTLVLSSTYRQRSSATPKLRERDPDNVLLARGPSKRLSAEILRDCALAAGGVLVEKTGGPPVKPPQPPGLWKGQNAFLPEYVQDRGEGSHRRSLYTFWRRTSPPPDMLALDAPSREVCIVRRQTTNTPLQPLVLMNDPQFVEAAVGLGQRMLKDGGDSLADRITFAFRVAATRCPSSHEQLVLEGLFQEQLTLFRSEPHRALEFLETVAHIRPPGLDSAELAAAAVTASVLLNLDAAVTTR